MKVIVPKNYGWIEHKLSEQEFDHDEVVRALQIVECLKRAGDCGLHAAEAVHLHQLAVLELAQQHADDVCRRPAAVVARVVQCRVEFLRFKFACLRTLISLGSPFKGVFAAL